MSAFVLPKDVMRALARFDDAGKEAFCVGGCVRDILRGQVPHDWDITTACTPDETLSLFSEHKTIPTGIAHGTVTVILDGSSLPLEITTFRIDGGYADHRRPNTVQFTASIVEDCARRDFTVNAMAYHPTRGLVDPFGGQSDLAARIVRCVGDPTRRFDEDALRILRALRFSSVLDFDIEPNTAHAAHTTAHTLIHVSKERLYTEFMKLLGGVRAAELLCAYPNVLTYVMPTFSALSDTRLHTPLIKAFSRLSDAETRLAASLYLCGASVKQAKKELHTLTASNAVTDTVCSLLSTATYPIPNTRIAMRRRRAVTPYALLRKEICLHAALHDISSKEGLALLCDIEEKKDPVALSALAVNGHDLEACGYRGAEIGAALQSLLDAVIEERVENEKEALIKFLHI